MAYGSGRGGNRGDKGGQQSDLVKVGGLWKSPMQNGGTKLSGPLSPEGIKAIGKALGEAEAAGQELRILILPNTYKEEDRHPDYNLFLAPKREREGGR